MQLIYKSEKVTENIKVADGIYRLTIKGSFTGRPGQFYMLRCWDNEPILSRPISIHHLDDDKISFLYLVTGEGTKLLKKLKTNDEVKLSGPFGDNGFPINDIRGKVAIVTGGVGIAPMLYCAEKLQCESVDLFAGFKDEVHTVDKFDSFVNNVYVSTENGNEGYKGFVTDLLQPQLYDVVLCCGPSPMMKKVIMMCRQKSVKAYVSMEKHMACGIGACLVCTCKTKDGNKRTCKDGPVFCADDLLNEL